MEFWTCANCRDTTWQRWSGDSIGWDLYDQATCLCLYAFTSLVIFMQCVAAVVRCDRRRNKQDSWWLWSPVCNRLWNHVFIVQDVRHQSAVKASNPTSYYSLWWWHAVGKIENGFKMRDADGLGPPSILIAYIPAPNGIANGFVNVLLWYAGR